MTAPKHGCNKKGKNNNPVKYKRGNTEPESKSTWLCTICQGLFEKETDVHKKACEAKKNREDKAAAKAAQAAAQAAEAEAARAAAAAMKKKSKKWNMPQKPKRNKMI